MAAADGPEKESLTTRRLVLTPVAAAHARALHALINDWEVVRMLAELPWPIPPESVEAFAARQEQRAMDETAFTIFAADAPVGVCSVKHPGSGEHRRTMPRLGYWIGRPHWGQGYATEAIAALSGYAFERFPQATVIGAGVFIDNPASRRVLEKLGFERVRGYSYHCTARDEPVELDDMNLTRARWAAGAEER
jgi:RimJ/RimL family protein N-acetyltransferase